tara:strand:- start:32985 stop:40364 length:7380 start_codon:yes stop_codon:yes gene_type:complete
MITTSLSRCYRVLLILAVSLVLNACGGGGGGSSTEPGSDNNFSTRTGIFSDSPVSGLTYTFNSEFYKTNNAGRFEYRWDDILGEVAEKTSFYLGGFLLGEVSGKSNVTPLDIFGATSTSDPRVVNLLRLLQTLDNDDDPSNGIEILPSVQEQFTQSLNINWADDIFSNNSPITTILDTAKPDASIVSAENAVAHFIDQISELPEIELFSVGGNLSGLIGNVELEINGDSSITVSPSDTAFIFGSRLISGAPYSVTIKTISASQTCVLQNPIGTISNSDINGVSLTCSEIVGTEQYQIGGSVSNLKGSLSIRNNTTSEDLTITTNGAFSFNTLQLEGSFYNISILENPANQSCSFTPSTSAEGQIQQQDISSINIFCTDNLVPRYMVSGSITGLTTEQPVSLSINGGQASIFTGDTFAFPKDLLDGENYSVTVTSKPSYYTCLTENAQGVIDGSDISNIEVNCSHDAFNIGGQVSGHDGPVTISLSENGTQSKQTSVVTSASSFVFEGILDGTEYAISAVIDEATGQTCQVSNASATLAGSHIANANIVCSDIPSYAIGGNIQGLSGTLVLRNNSVDNLTTTNNGSFEFGAKLVEGQSYSVEIVSQPASQDCLILSGTESGNVQNTAINTIAISCSDLTFNVQAAATGHSSNLSLVLSIDGQAQAAVLLGAQDAAYDFGQFAYNSTIDISATAPEGQSCQLTNGSSEGLMADLSATIVCTDIITHSVSTTVSGLPENETLNVVINDLSAARPNGTMSQNLVDEATLAITVSSFPEGYNCTVSEYTSPVITDQNVTIACSQNTYEVSGTVLGLQGLDQVSLLFSGQSVQTYSATNNAFSFTLAHGNSFALTSDDSLKYNCAIFGGDISSVTSPVSNILLTCEAPTYKVSGSISSHAGTVTVTYDDQYGEPTTQQVASGTSGFEFSGLYNGAQFQVTASIDQSANQSCTGSNTTNTINDQDISNIAIVCSNDPTYSIGGTITGLARGSVTLVNTIDGTETDVKEFSNTGSFVMSQALFAGQNYDVSVQSDPSTQTCAVKSGGQGQVSGAVQNIVVECLDVTQHTITTTIQGLENTDVISVSIDGGIAQSQGNGSIQTLVYEGQSFSLTLSNVPDKYTCTPLTENINEVTQNETVTVSCLVKNFTVSGTVNGLGSETAGLSFNGQTAVNYANNQSFSFSLPYGSSFSVIDNSLKYNCEIDGGNILSVTTRLNNLVVTCVAPTYKVSGTISSHSATVTVTYDDQYGEPVSQSIASGISAFEFTGLFNGAQFQVTFSIDQSANQSCTGSNTTNTINGQDISNITIVCSNDPTYSIGGTITGLARGSVTLVNTIDGSEADEKIILNAGSFAMNRTLYAGQNYNISVQNSPSTQTCYVQSGGQGAVFGSVENIIIQCDDFSQYTITAEVQGLDSTDTVGVTINGAAVQAIGNGTIQTLLYQGENFTFALSNIPNGYYCSPLTEEIISVSQNQTVLVVCAELLQITGTVTGHAQDIRIQIDAENFVVVSVNESAFSITGLSLGNNYTLQIFDEFGQPLQAQVCEFSLPTGFELSGELTESIIGADISCIGSSTLLQDLPMSAELYNCVSQNGALTTIGDVGSNLSCTYQGITNLNGIQYLSQLEKLNLQSNSIPQSEMSYLYDLDSLTLLNLAGNDLVIDNTLVNELEEALPFTVIRYTDTNVGSAAGSALLKIDVSFSPQALTSISDPGSITLVTPYWGGINCDSENLGNCNFRSVERSFSGNYSRVHEVNYDTLNDLFIKNPDYSIDQSALNDQLECSAFSSSSYSNSDGTIYINCGLKTIRDISGSVVGDIYGYIPNEGLVIEAYLDNVKVSEVTLGYEPTEYHFADINEGYYELRLSPNDTLCSLDNALGNTSGTIIDANLSCGQIKNVVSDLNLISCLESSNPSSNSINSVGTSVDCSNYGISDLSGIQHFTQIQELTLAGNSLENDDFDSSADPIYALKNNLNLLDINGNYGIRLTSICDGTIPSNLPFTVVRNSDLNCAGPDRTVDVGVNVSSLVANYFTDFGTAYLRGIRLHGWSSDTFNVTSSALTDSYDYAYFSGVRDGSSASLDFDFVRPSLECFDNYFEITRNISTTEECTAKQLVDINVTLDGGGYDVIGREALSVSGLELIYQRDYPYTDNFISSVGSDWTPGNEVVFSDFPSGENDVSVEPGYNYNFFNAPDYVYCTSSGSKTIGLNGNDRSFIVPCSQSYVYGPTLPASVEPVSEYADERVNYSLHLESGTDNQQLILELALGASANVLVTNSTSNTNIATSGATNLTRLREWPALSGQSNINFEGFTESGTYWLSIQNTDVSAENLYSLGMQLASVGYSSQVSLRPLKLIQPVTIRTWQQTFGNEAFPADRLNNSYDRLVVRQIPGAGQLATASVKITLTSAVDTYLILTNDNGTVMAVSDDAGATNRSVIFKDLAPGNYNVIPATFSEVNSPTDYVLTYESSMPAFTYID